MDFARYEFLTMGHSRFHLGLLSVMLVVFIHIEARAASDLSEFYEDEGLGRHTKDSIGKGIQAVADDARALVTAPLRMDRYDALMATGALAIVGGTYALDHDIRTIAKRNSTPTGQDLASAFETVGNQPTLLGFNAGLIAVGVVHESWGGSGGLKVTGLISLEAQLFAAVGSLALKEVFGRSRPNAEHGTTDFHPFSGGGSFPSTHAASSFAIAAVLADRSDPAVGWLAYAVATGVAASRVYADEHFASDIVAGSLLGWGLGTFLSRLHPENPSDWTIKPLSLDHGQGFMIGRRF